MSKIETERIPLSSITESGTYYAYFKSNDSNECYSAENSFEVVINKSLPQVVVQKSFVNCLLDSAKIDSLEFEISSCSDCEVTFFRKEVRGYTEVTSSQISIGEYFAKAMDRISGCEGALSPFSVEALYYPPSNLLMDTIFVDCDKGGIGVNELSEIELNCENCEFKFYENVDGVNMEVEKLITGYTYEVINLNLGTGCTSKPSMIRAESKINSSLAPLPLDTAMCVNERVTFHEFLENKKKEDSNILVFKSTGNMEVVDLQEAVNSETYYWAWQDNETKCQTNVSKLVINKAKCSGLIQVVISGTIDSVSFSFNGGGLNTVELPFTYEVDNYDQDEFELYLAKLIKSGFVKVNISYNGNEIEVNSISDPYESFSYSYNSILKKKTILKKSPEEWKCGYYNGKLLFEGPKGGCYYINSNSNKTYVDRSNCACF